MVDIKRLHEVHSYYPNVPRRMGKTTYCYDSLLRVAQTGYYKHIAYVTNYSAEAVQRIPEFREFLGKYSNVQCNRYSVIIDSCAVHFIGVKEYERNYHKYETIIGDYHD